MSKINQIEKALQEIDATKFHKLVDAYLSKAYEYKIVSNGTKLAEDKPIKGTPDSYVILENGNYIFIEYTTQKTNVTNKFVDDIKKCFNTSKTNIDINNIEKIILACNTDLNVSEVKTLKDLCSKNNTDCLILCNSTIANELFNKYSNIAKDFLNITVDTRQILDYDDFIQNFDSNKFSTSLNINLKGRNEEYKTLYQNINDFPIVLVTGSAGVGKTKLSIEVVKSYAKTNDYKFKAILNRGADIFDDMISYFNNENKKYLILIDDVNRIHIALDYALNYFAEKIKSGDIKIIATVRDYAKDKIIDNILDKVNFAEFDLQALTEESIKEIIKTEFKINNTLYLDRIRDISQGNPRLAIMSALIVNKENSLEPLYDVTSIYDEYFSNIRKDLNIFDNKNLLLTIVIVSFFRTIDKSNKEHCQLIETTFNISINNLWENIEILNNLEIFDLYENEVVKISDQILSTYLFYKIVFVDKKIDIRLFLNSLFPKYIQKFVDVLSPLLNTFDTKIIINVLKQPIDELWEKNINDESFIYNMMGVFWYLKQTDIQNYFNKKINSLDTEVFKIDKIDYWTTTNTNEIKDKILDKLSIFRYDSLQSIQITIELILKYFSKKPSLATEVIKTISNSYTYHYESYRFDYEKEFITLNTIWEKCENGKNELISKLFIRICDDLLKIECEEHISKKRTISFQRFKLAETKKLKLLRNKIFEKLSILYKKEKYKNDILKLFEEYPSKISWEFGISKVEKWDSKNIIKFIKNNFTSKSYQEVKVVQIILEHFKKYSLIFDSNLEEQYTHELYDLEKILMIDDVDISLEFPRDKEEKTDWDKIRNIHKQRLYDFVKTYTLSDWENLFEKCKIIEKKNRKEDYKFKNNLTMLFIFLAEKNPNLYLQVLDKYLKLGNLFKLRFYPSNLYEILGKDETKKFINQYTFNLKDDCLFNFYNLLKEEDIDKDDVNELLDLYKNTDVFSVPYGLDYLKKYLNIEKNIFILVVQTLVQRAINENPQFFHSFDILFNHANEISKDIEKYFKEDMGLIKQCYLISMDNHKHHDHDATYLNKLIDYDKNFLTVYIDKLFEGKEYLTKYDIHPNFSILWGREDFETIFFNLIDLILSKTSTRRYLREGDILEAFFELNKNKSSFKNLNYCIKKFIDTFSHNENKMTFIFDYISTLNDDFRKQYILYFLKNNKSFKLFNKLSLEPTSKSASGSWVPVYQKDIDFYNSLLKNINGIDLLEHRQKIEKQISYIEQDIKREKKRDFMYDY
ncbi:hypothetical protein CSA08_04375 [Candidatus Gracilibacteria bacterium]|nr:MAG: hypothetical protein CSA08_04375 [Candidatus Gracilibacteria bacterium]